MPTIAAVAGLTLLIVIPVLMVIYGALQDASPVRGDTNWSLDALRDTYASTDLLRPLRNTLVLGIVVTVVAQTLGTAFAWLIARTDVRSRKTFAVLLIAPLFISPLTGAMSWLVLGAPDIGFLNVAWKTLGGDADIVNIFSFAGVAFVMTLYYVPFSFLAVSAMLANMDSAVEESAQSLGASTWQTARRITVPLVLPAIAASGLLVFILAVEIFSIPGLLGRPFHFETLITNVYIAVRSSPAQWNNAAAIGTVLLFIAGAALVVQKLVVGHQSKYAVMSGRGYRGGRISLGRLRVPATAILAAYVMVGVVLPMAALVLASFLKFTTTNFENMIFTSDHYQTVTSSVAGLAIKNTVILALTVPTTLVLVALAIAYLHRHGTGIVPGILRGFSTLPMALPGIILGVGLLWTYFRVPLPIYGTLLILFLAYVTKMLPEAVNTVLPSLTQIDMVMEDSARSLGARAGLIVRRIVAPMVAPGLFSAWLLVFILASRELNASIMLYSPSSRVLEVLIWDFLESGRSNAAYALSVLQSLAIFVVASFVLRRQLRNIST